MDVWTRTGGFCQKKILWQMNSECKCDFKFKLKIKERSCMWKSIFQRENVENLKPGEIMRTLNVSSLLPYAWTKQLLYISIKELVGKNSTVFTSSACINSFVGSGGLFYGLTEA